MTSLLQHSVQVSDTRMNVLWHQVALPPFDSLYVQEDGFPLTFARHSSKVLRRPARSTPSGMCAIHRSSASSSGSATPIDSGCRAEYSTWYRSSMRSNSNISSYTEHSTSVKRCRSSSWLFRRRPDTSRKALWIIGSPSGPSSYADVPSSQPTVPSLR